MDTQNLNLNPDSGNENSEKAEKIKKAAAKAGKFGAAAAVGVVGTMSAEAMLNDKEDVGDIPTPTPTPTPTPNPVTPEPEPEKPTQEVISGEAVTDFDPNDIVIDVTEVEEPENGDGENENTNPEDPNQDVAEVGPEPITGEDDVVEVQGEEVLIAQTQPDDYDPEEFDVDPDPCMYGGPEGWDDTDEDPSDWIAEDDVTEDPDILDDIMNA